MSRRCCAKDCYNSALTNKNVVYFGFPKSEHYAHQWAIAAGREDLLSKPILNLIKYFLCSEHFTDDCFTDATRTTLKKQSRPKVIVPLPTIFKNNIIEFAPDTVKQFIEEKQSTAEPTKSFHNNNTTRLTQSTAIHEDCDADRNHLVVEYVENPETTSNSLHVYLVPSTHDFTLKELIENESTVECDESGSSFESNVCRLCAANFADSDEFLISIFDDDDLKEIIENLLPGIIFKDDGKPQQICHTCYEQVKFCNDTINSFYIAQGQFD